MASEKNDKIDGFSESHLLKKAAEVCQEKADSTTIFDEEAEERIPKFQMDELTCGRVLGRGGFCVVQEITDISLHDNDNSKSNTTEKISPDQDHQFTNIVQDRHFMSLNYKRKGKDYRYAMKRLKEDVRKDAQMYISGIVDLAMEARFLAVIRHPNIIKMRGTFVGHSVQYDYFLVLDRLYDLLPKRLSAWKKRQMGTVKAKLLDRKGKKQVAFWVERIAVAHDLACALKYLHHLNIIYRDIKPDNIGFDVRGDVKIFDFGLSREIDPNKATKDGLYALTQDTGSPRYMAPEVALGQPYNERADVYSFSILLYQMLALETPFDIYTTVKTFQKKVVHGGVRPKCDAKWAPAISSLMKNGWSTNISSRPTMEEVVSILRDEIEANTDEDIVDSAVDASRKSEMSRNNNTNTVKT